MLLKKIICVFSVLLIFFCNNVFAATKEDVITAINKTYTVGDETYRLPQKIITKGENYLNKNKLTTAQYDNILRCIDNAVALAREVGTTDIKKVSKEDLNRALTILTEASASANLDLNEELAEGDIDISEIVNPPPVIEPEVPDLPVGEEINTGNEQPTVDNTQKNDTESKPNKAGQNNDNKGQITDSNKPADNKENNVLPEANSNISTESNNNQQVNKKTNSEIDIIINRNINKVIGILIVILFIFILIFYLIFKTKWNKIFKYMLMIIFVILILIVLYVLVEVLYYIEEIKLIYKLYYMFN